MHLFTYQVVISSHPITLAWLFILYTSIHKAIHLFQDILKKAVSECLRRHFSGTLFLYPWMLANLKIHLPLHMWPAVKRKQKEKKIVISTIAFINYHLGTLRVHFNKIKKKKKKWNFIKISNFGAFPRTKKQKM